MPQAPDKALVFAAGFGTRMAPLTDSVPKPLIQIAGRALIDHALALCKDAGLTHVVINLHYRSTQIRQHIGARRGIVFSEEQPRILETGGGLRHALPLLGLPYAALTLNSDAVWTGPNPVRTALSAWAPDRMDALLVMVPKTGATGHTGAGDFAMAADGRLSRAPGDVYAGVQIVRTALLHQIGDEIFSLNRVWDIAAATGRLFGVRHEGGWCDVGRPSSIALAERMLQGAL
jgi:MurNAc alpha-1-phosphate uridylyltransferase